MRTVANNRSTLCCMRRRVAITGIGAVSSLGVGASALWEGLVAGRSGLGPITRFDPGGFPSRLGGEISDFSARDHVPKSYRKAVKVMARDIEIAVAAAAEAVRDAGLVTRIEGGAAGGEESEVQATYPGARFGCQIGAGLIAADTDELTGALATSLDGQGKFSWQRWGSEAGAEPGADGAMGNLQPLWLLKYLPNMLACHVTILHGAEGPSNTITCGEASGLLSAGEATRVIERGDADLCFAGGAESKLNLMGMVRVQVAGRLAATGESQDALSFYRPFDEQASGGLLGEGGAVVIVEAIEQAQARGARVYAELAGFGAGQSTPPLPGLGLAELDLDGPRGPKDISGDAVVNDGLVVAIEAALADASMGADQIDAIVPAGVGSLGLDRAEAGALRAVFGERLARVPLVTIRPNIGECMAGAGALQLAVGSQMIAHQRLPARLHAGTPQAGLLAGRSDSCDAVLGAVLVCSTSLGGQNAAVVLRKMTV